LLLFIYLFFFAVAKVGISAVSQSLFKKMIRGDKTKLKKLFLLFERMI